MNDFWSEEKQKITREKIFPGAVVKNTSHKHGIFTFKGAIFESDVVIKSIESGGGFLPTAGNEVLAEFSSVDDMIDAGWVMD